MREALCLGDLLSRVNVQGACWLDPLEKACDVKTWVVSLLYFTFNAINDFLLCLICDILDSS